MTIRVAGVLDTGAIGGVLTYSVLLSELLAPFGVDYRIYSPDGVGEAAARLLEDRGCCVRELGDLREDHPDVVQVHYHWSHGAVLRSMAGQRWHAPIAGTLHGAQIVRPSARAFAGRRFDDALKNLFVSCLIAVGPEWRGGRWLIRRPVAVIPNAGPEPRCCAPVECRAAQAGTITVGYVGRFSQEKGVDRLAGFARSMTKLVGRDGFRLSLWGSGPLAEVVISELRQLCEVSVGEGVVEWNTLDAIVLPSYQEGSPMVIAEALSNGVKVVSSAVADHGDWPRDTPGLSFVNWTSHAAARRAVEAARSDHECASSVLNLRRAHMAEAYSSIFHGLVAR